MSEELLVKHCAPTLAGMKTGSLFNCSYDCINKLQKQINEFNCKLNPKGVHIRLLSHNKVTAFIYVYRPSKLERTISNKEEKEFLTQKGYYYYDIDNCIEQLCMRLSAKEEFPHEIGLFLGYPLADVKEFIKNNGSNCKCVGYWKVYTNENNTLKIFEKYKKCTSLYCKKYIEGLSIQKLTVNA